MTSDPVATNPGLYRVLFENDRVRVLAYLDAPGDATAPHGHPDSVMITLSGFDRRLVSGSEERIVHLEPETVAWLPAQEHSGENTGETATRVIFVELKEPALREPTPATDIGPADHPKVNA